MWFKKNILLEAVLRDLDAEFEKAEQRVKASSMIADAVEKAR